MADEEPTGFARALARVLVHEGGKVDHPQDPGGRTNQGVTQRVYNGWRAKNNMLTRDVYLIEPREVEAIYRSQFWAPINGDKLPEGLAYVVFDGAVNSGTKQSVKWLQRALGFVPAQVDGVIGNVTMGAIETYGDVADLISKICDRRMVFLKALKTWPTFGRGWSRRVASVRETGLAWALSAAAPNTAPIRDGNAKAGIEDARKAPSKSPGDVSMGVGGAGAAIPQAIDQLNPFATIAFIKNLIVGLTILGVVLMLGGYVWRSYATKRKAELDDALDTVEAKP